MVQEGVDVPYGLDDLPNAHERKEVATDRHDDAVDGDERVLA
jgi:hypothetical protein